MDEEETTETTEDDGLTYAERSLLTLEKLSEFKQMFDYHKKDTKAKISQMREDIISNFKGFLIKISEFDAFFKRYDGSDTITEDEFYDTYNYYEQKILEKAAVYDEKTSEQSKEVDVAVDENENENEANHYMEEVIIGDDSDEEPEDDKDPEVSLQDIVDHIIDTGSLTAMNPQKIGKIFKKIKEKVDQVNVKMQTMDKKMASMKNKSDVYKNEKEYYTRKIDMLKAENSELSEAKYKLEADVEDLMKFEADFQRMVKQ
jgi:predicted small metal-binding protein